MSTLTGTTALARLVVRRDRVRMAVWVLAMTLLTYSSGSAMGTTFPTQASIDSYASSMATSPAVIFLAGPPVALDTLPGIVLNKVSFLGLVGVCLMTVLQVVRHTRAEEEEGRAELVRAGVVGRDAALAATVLVTGAAALLVGAGQALATNAAQVPLGDALLYGASVAALGLVFAGIALCTAQVFTHARAASGSALALFGVAYVVRGAGDVQGNGLVWLSPIGWSQATHATGADATWWPLLVPVVVSAVLVGLAAWLQRRRDEGAGLVSGRPGRAQAARSLSGAFGLALRTQRPLLVGWALGLFALGAVYGSLTQGVEDLARSNPTLEEFFRASGQGSLVDSFRATMLLVLALLAGAYAVGSALRLTSEETSGRLEPLLATGLSRARWMLGTLAMTLVGSATVLLAAGAGLGSTYAMSTGDPSQLLRIAGLELVYLPAVLVPAGIAALVHGWRPGWARVAWVVLAVWFVLGYLGELLNAPEWLVRTSPFTRTPSVPVASLSLTAPLVITLLVALLTAVGVTALRHRDLQTH
ncbi:polyketide antibiotic transporter [Nocardioides panacis]|uniref:Polyketide antibiotic transporter n=1 Tax=Nocardioides panacis TaxID=2849501 RepID=A0A975Y0E3_9ACTN|nr:polyketide antibiotic transporter [Nocardioides panacis]QWZ08239.1 polyketide antibiotic transporter [Nocardioides panacis]